MNRHGETTWPNSAPATGTILVEYARRWREAAAAEPVEFRKANAGRFAANAWLKEVGRKNHPPGTHHGFAQG